MAIVILSTHNVVDFPDDGGHLGLMNAPCDRSA